jgi:hypothetical protein
MIEPNSLYIFIPGIVGSLSGLVAACTALYSVLRNTRLLKSQGVVLDEHGIMLHSVDNAVNGKSPGEYTIGEQVEQMADTLTAQKTAAKLVLDTAAALAEKDKAEIAPLIPSIVPDVVEEEK